MLGYVPKADFLYILDAVSRLSQEEDGPVRHKGCHDLPHNSIVHAIADCG